MDLLTRVTIGTKRGTTWTRDAPVQIFQFDVPSCISMPKLQTRYEGKRLQPRG